MGQLLKLVGDETGFASLVDVGDELIQEALVESIANPPEIEELGEITSLSKGWTFLAQTFGEQIPNLLLAATGAGMGAGIGAFVTRAAVTRATLNTVARRAAAAGLNPQTMGRRYFAQNPALRQLSLSGKGAAAGTFGAFYPINTGEAIQEQRDAHEAYVAEHGDRWQSLDYIAPPSLGSNLAVGAVLSGLEVVGFAGVARAVFGDAKKEVVEHMLKTVLRRIGHASLKSLAVEGGTEAVQEAIVIASKKLNDPTFSITDAITSSEGLSRIAFAGASGAVVGAGLGGGGGIATGARDAFRVNRARADLRDVANAGISAAQGSVPSTESEVADSLFDLDKFAAETGKAVSAFADKAKTAAKAVLRSKKDSKNYPESTVRTAVAAAKKLYKDTSDGLKADRAGLRRADQELVAKRLQFAAGIAALRAAVKAVGRPAQDSTAGNEASHKSGKAIDTLIDDFGKLRGPERAKGAIKLLEEARNLALRAMTDPRVATKNQILSLISKAEAAINNSHTQTARASEKYWKKLKVLRTRAAIAIKKVRVAEGTLSPEEAAKMSPEDVEALQEAEDNLAVQEELEQEGIQTQEPGIMASLESVADPKSTKTHAFAIGNQIKGLAKAVVAKAKELKLEKRDDVANNRVIFARPENIDKDPEAESFATNKDQLNADSPVVTPRDPAGTAIQDEGTAATPEALNEAVGRAETMAGEDGTVEVRTQEEAVLELVDEVNVAAEATEIALKEGNQSISQIYRAITGLGLVTGIRTAMKKLGNITIASTNKQKPTVANIPDDLVVLDNGMTWGQFKTLYSDAEELATKMANLENKHSNPDAFRAVASTALAEDMERFEEQLTQIFAFSRDDENSSGNVDEGELFGLGVRRPSEDGSSFFASDTRGRLVPVVFRPTPTGIMEVYQPEGIPLKQGLTEAQMRTKAGNPSSKQFLDEFHLDKEKPLVDVYDKDGKLVEEGYIKTEQHNGMWLVRGTKETNVATAPVLFQLRRVTRRGRGTPNKDDSPYIVTGKSPPDEKGKRTKVYIHLGEVTRLGQISTRRANNATVLDTMVNAHQNFLAGLSYMYKLGYQISFRPESYKLPNGKIKRARKGDADKVIWAQTTWNQSKEFNTNVVPEIVQAFKSVINNRSAVVIAIEKALTPKIIKKGKKGKKDKNLAKKTKLDVEQNTEALLESLPKAIASYEEQSTKLKDDIKAAKGERKEQLRAKLRFVNRELAKAKRELKALGKKQKNIANLPKKALPTWNDIADWLLDEAAAGRIERSDVSAVLFRQGVIDPALLDTFHGAATSTAPNYTDPASFQQEEPLRNVDAIGQKTTHVVQERYGDHYVEEVVEFSEKETKSGRTVLTEEQRSGEESIPSSVQFRSTPGAELEGPSDITHETNIQEFSFADEQVDPSTPRAERTTYKHRAEASPNLFVPENTQVFNLIKGWKGIDKAVTAVLNRLNIKESVVLFNDASIPAMLIRYQEIVDNEANTQTQRQLAAEYIERLKVIQIEKPAGRIIHQLGPINERAVHIYVPRKNGTTKSNRGWRLAHELGHLVQYVYSEQLPDATKKELYEALAPGKELKVQQETFANWMATEIVRNEFKKVAGKDTSLQQHFARIMEGLQIVYDWAASSFGRIFKNWERFAAVDLPDGIPLGRVMTFRAFVEGLNTYAAHKKDSSAPATTAIGQKFFDALESTDAGLYVRNEILSTTNNFPTSLVDIFNKGKQQYKDLKAKRIKAKQEHEARIIPEEQWWVNAPKGKLLDLTSPHVKQVLQEYGHWDLVNDPETEPWRTRSRSVANHLIHSKLITQAEFRKAVIAAEKNAEQRYLAGEMSLEQLKQVDLRNMLIEIINSRVTRGDFYDLSESIQAKLPGEIDYARNDPQTMALAGYEGGVYKPPGARAVANAKWSRNKKPTVEELLNEAEAEVYSWMAEAYYQDGESINAAESLAHEIGRSSEQTGVEVTDRQLIDFIENSSLLEQEALVADFDESVDSMVERSRDSVLGNYYDNFKRWARTFIDNPALAVSTLFKQADTELRKMGKVGPVIAGFFRALPGMPGDSLTVFRETMMRAGPHHNALKAVLDSLPIARIGLWEGIFNKKPTAEVAAKRAQRDRITEALLLQTKPSEVSADIKAEVAAIRKYLDNLYNWYTGSTEKTFVINGVKMKGMNLPLTQRGFKDEEASYYPLMVDTMFLDKHRDEFVAILTRYDFTEKDAQNIRKKITHDEDGGLNNGFHEDAATDEFFGPGASYSTQRSNDWPLEMRQELVEAGFYQKDIGTTLIAYTEMMVRRAVWQTRFQETDFTTPMLDRYKAAGLENQIHSPVAKLQLMVHEARDSGDINQWQYNRIIRDILPAYAGQLGLRTNPHIRKLSSGVVIYQNVRLLPFAIFAQFVDVGTLAQRGTFKDFEVALQGMLDEGTREEAYTMLRALGAIRDGITEHVLNDQTLNTFTTGTAKRINDLFFRYNGMEGWTNMIRVAAMISGREFIKRNAAAALKGDAKAQSYMDNLGLGNPEELNAVNMWEGHLTDNDQINAALLRYVDEAMIRPDSTIRPVHMSDPGYMIFNHLKSFLWGFHATFLQPAIREARVHQNLLPLFTLGMLALPFAAVGYELRRWITSAGSPRPRPEGFGYMAELGERAGLLGPFQLVVDMEQADAYGKPFALGVGGPAVEQLFDFFDRDLSSWVPRAIPLMASSPPLRDWGQGVLTDD